MIMSTTFVVPNSIGIVYVLYSKYNIHHTNIYHIIYLSTISLTVSTKFENR